jgi:hypothetical protein
MAAERKIIDVEDNPNLAELARAVRDSGEEIVVREGGRNLVVVRPLSPSEIAYIDDPEDRRKGLMDFAGSMEGLIELDLMREIYASRGGRSRSAYKLPERTEEEIAARWKRILELAGTMPDLVPDDFVEENYKIRSASSRYLPDEE